MLEKGKISSRQFSVLITLYIIGSSILTIPAMLAGVAKQDAWISALLALAVGLLLIPMYIHLGDRFSHSTFILYTEKVLGKWLGKGVSLLFFVIYPFLIAILSMRNIGDFMTTEVMPTTPIQAIHILFIFIVIMAVRLGIEPLARATEIFFPIVILLLIIFVILISPQIEIKNIQPMMEEGIKPILKASLNFIAYPFLEPIILITLFPYVNHPGKNGKALFSGFLLGGIIMVVMITLTVLVIGANTATVAYPSYALAKKISIGNFIERMEVIIAVIWFITIFVRIALLFYVAIIGIAQVLNLKEYRFLTLPMSIILVILSFVVFPNTAYYNEFTPIWTVHSFILGFVFPIMLLIIGSLRKK